MKVRKSQLQRREETRQKVLESACRLFGQNGFDHTSLEDIASDCGLTVTPIYHYFGNKLQLFTEVNTVTEQQLLNLLERFSSNSVAPDLQTIWEAFTALCRQPGFARIVLIDSPYVLGRERWLSSPVARKAKEILSMLNLNLLHTTREQDQELIIRIIIAGLAEVAVTLGTHPDYDSSHLMQLVLNMLHPA